jgi:hypothetical protein
MKKVNEISSEEFLKKVREGVSKNVIWQKPFLLLTNNGDEYNDIVDTVNEFFRSRNINADAVSFEFVRADNKLEMSLGSVIVDGHHPDVDIYEYYGGPLSYDEKIHRYCVDLCEYEGKPVISFISLSDKNCSIENIPAWMFDEFEIAILKD